MNIVVCIKQVPDPEHFSKVSLDPVTKTISREGIPAIINPLDKNALEEGL
ncbi:MAG: electron transfer flavoprotein subunit beta/FixA family protein, partial [Dehalococcoidia bacterium]